MTENKKLAIIGTVGLPANYGGFETLTSHLVDHLSEDYDMTVYCSGKRYPKEERVPEYKNARLKYLPLDANGVQSIFYDTLSIIHALLYADILLILGVSGAWILPFVKIFTNKKIVISIDGIEWKRNKWSLPAKMYLYWAEKIAVKFSHIDISDNESIQNYTALRYGSLSNVIEYGADHTMQVEPEKEDVNKYPFLAKPYAFKVCRIEPENNVHDVLSAFNKTKRLPIVMVGNWKNSAYGIELKEKYKNSKNVLLLDPIYNQRNLDLLRSNTTLYVHGHSAGGTNPSLVEAMYLGLPVFAFGVSYNRTTTEDKASYFHNEAELIELINKTDLKQLGEMAKNMLEIAKRRYNWKLIASKYNQLFLMAFKTKEKKNVMPSIAGWSSSDLKGLKAAHLSNHHLFYES